MYLHDAREAVWPWASVGRLASKQPLIFTLFTSENTMTIAVSIGVFLSPFGRSKLRV